MLTVDPFTAAQPTFRRAADLGAQPMPLAAFEVATFKRRPSFYGSILRGFVGVSLFLAVVWMAGCAVS